MSTNITNLSKTKTILFSYGTMLLCGIGITLAALLTAKVLNAFYTPPPVCVRICEYVGYLCWAATLGARGWDIQSWREDIPPEKFYQNLDKILSLIGIFAFVLARELALLTG